MSVPRAGQVLDEYNRPVPGSVIYVYNEDGTQAVLTTDGTTPLAQPVSTDQFGVYTYYVASAGTYREDTWYGGKIRFKEVLLLGPAITITTASGSTASDRVALAGIASPTNKQSAILSESGREGTFVFSTANLSTQVSNDPNQGVYVAPASDTTGASGAWVRKPWLAGVYPASHFGARGDGATDDTATINAALTFAGYIGGGKVWLGPGTYLLSNSNSGASNWDDYRALYIGHDHVHLKCAGKSLVKLKLANSANCHVIQVGMRAVTTVTCTDVHLSGFDLDGNRANQMVANDTTNHWSGIEVETGCTDVHIYDFEIHDTQYYGIGMQRDNISRSSIHHGYIHDTGDDGIDWKNDNGTGYGNLVYLVTVKNCAMESALTEQKSAFDFRSGIYWHDLTFLGTTGKPDTCGLRVQVDANSTDSIIPAHPTSGWGFTGIGSNGSGSYGVRIMARNTKAGGLSVGQFDQGIRVSAGDVKVTQFDLYSNYRGLVLDVGTTSSAVTGEYLAGTIRGSTTDGILINAGTENTFTVDVRNNGTGYNIALGSDSNRFIGGSCSGNTTQISNAAASTIVRNVSGLRTSSRASASFPLTAVGVQTVTIAHGLGVTPAVSDVILSNEENTAVDDWAYSWIKIVSTDATNVTAKVKIATASATTGSYGTLRAHCDALAA